MGDNPGRSVVVFICDVKEVLPAGAALHRAIRFNHELRQRLRLELLSSNALRNVRAAAKDHEFIIPCSLRAVIACVGWPRAGNFLYGNHAYEVSCCIH